MSWQCPGSDRHKVTASFRSNAFEVDTKLLLASAQMPLKLIQSAPQQMSLPISGLSQDIM